MKCTEIYGDDVPRKTRMFASQRDLPTTGSAEEQPWMVERAESPHNQLGQSNNWKDENQSKKME